MIDKFPEDTHTIEGEGVLFKVSVQGNPKPSFTWYFDQSELPANSGVEVQSDGTLFISYVQIKHSGVYKLLVKNVLGTVEKSFKLFVNLRELRRILPVNSGSDPQPVAVDRFGQYVSENHSHDNKGFKNQFMVKCYSLWLLAIL